MKEEAICAYAWMDMTNPEVVQVVATLITEQIT